MVVLDEFATGVLSDLIIALPCPKIAVSLLYDA
jgi:hypothetical protein